MSDHTQHWGSGVQNELAPLARELRHMIPDVYKGFAELHGAAMGAGALDVKTKELIALAIAISERCDGCIASHARGAFKHGATRAEVAETIGVTIMMNGGPATVYGPRALAAYDDFATSAPSA
jgi:AhpD family alkylhydroperoxidase